MENMSIAPKAAGLTSAAATEALAPQVPLGCTRSVSRVHSASNNNKFCYMLATAVHEATEARIR